MWMTAEMWMTADMNINFCDEKKAERLVRTFCEKENF